MILLYPNFRVVSNGFNVVRKEFQRRIEVTASVAPFLGFISIVVNTEQTSADPDPDLERINADLGLDLALPTKVDFYTFSNSCFTI
jgi:hypothetical protein